MDDDVPPISHGQPRRSADQLAPPVSAAAASSEHSGAHPQGTAAATHAEGYNSTSDAGGVSPTSRPMGMVGNSELQHPFLDPRYISSHHGDAFAGELSPTAMGPTMETQQQTLPRGYFGESGDVASRNASTSTAETIRGGGGGRVESGVQPAHIQGLSIQRRFVGGFDRYVLGSGAVSLHSTRLILSHSADHPSSALSTASAPTVIAGGSSTRNNSVATGQTNFTTSSAPAFGSQVPATRRRSSLTHSMWLNSLPLPAFGVQPHAHGRIETQHFDPANPHGQVDDPLAPLNLSSSTNLQQSVENLFSSGILTCSGGQAYLAPTSGPSSAPASPGILHEPSQYIHTHLPRRASLTPANLNLVGPVPPSASVIEQVRRESMALMASNSPGTSPALGSGSFLTATTGIIPPAMTGSSGNPEQFGQMQWGLRRKSMTPSTPPSLAMASPTKLTATASISRKSALGATLGEMNARSYSTGSAAGGRTPEAGLGGVTAGPRRASARPATAEGYIMAGEERRGSIRRARTAERDTSEGHDGESTRGLCPLEIDCGLARRYRIGNTHTTARISSCSDSSGFGLERHGLYIRRTTHLGISIIRHSS